MLELIVIKYLLSVENYVKYRHYIKIKDNKELERLYDILDHMMATYKRSVSFSEYKLTVLQSDPNLDYWMERLDESDIGEDVLSDLIKKIQEKQWSHDLALISIDVTEGRKDIDSILDHVNKIEQKVEVDETTFITDDLEELYESTVASPGLRWRLEVLNKSLGSLRKGDFGFLFARPETGKTTFLASEVSYFAGQANGPILWFNNEEQGNKVKVRLYQAALGCDLATLYSNRKASHEKYLALTKGNIKLYDNASVHKRQVERIVKEMNPSLILFDQIDKIKGFDNDREDLRLGAIYIWARELAKTYCPTIGVCQADVSGEGKKWLTMDNVANAKTSKQAEADWILGIGAVHDNGLEHVRYLHLSKNKLAGDPDSDPTMRHGKMEVQILPDIARYKEF